MSCEDFTTEDWYKKEQALDSSMSLQKYIDKFSEYAKNDKDKVISHRTYLLLFVSRLLKAAEQLSLSWQSETDRLLYSLLFLVDEYEQFMKEKSENYVDSSVIEDESFYVDTIADFLTVVFSYIGKYNLTDQLVRALNSKITTGRTEKGVL